MAVEQRDRAGLPAAAAGRPAPRRDLRRRAGRADPRPARTEGSAAHVPQVVVPVHELPTTHNGKRSERAARDAVNGAPVRNLAALRNPGASTRSGTPSDGGAAAGRGGGRRRARLRRRRDGGGVEGVPRRPGGVGIDPTANFFDLGGTSRQSMTILRRLRNELRRPVPVEAFLAAPTVEGSPRRCADRRRSARASRSCGPATGPSRRSTSCTASTATWTATAGSASTSTPGRPSAASRVR